ncbi:MAG: UDP-N-acetylmuramate--L-alanine ligase [Oscillospiraceae bacterium]
MSNFSISDLKECSNIHMIGIGGISMSALAEILLHFGYSVTGSDSKSSDLIKTLESNGAKITIGQSADNIKSPDLVCYTAAISDTDPELQKARTLGVPVIERAELLGAIMEKYDYPIAIAGTHGKTTTTSMMSLVLMAAKCDPTILVGGELSQIGGNYHVGGTKYLPFEACEYVDTFLQLYPAVSVITNVEEDHLDYFTGLQHIISSFEKFARLTSPLGCNIVCSDDKNACEVVKNAQGNILYYGIKSEKSDYIAKNIKYTNEGLPKFDIYHKDKFVTSVALNVAGDHNILNSLGVAAAAEYLGISPEYIKVGLEDFSGTKRRFDYLGKCGEFHVVDDYAHHPTEIKATLNTAKGMPYNTIWVVFQPHTYTRTKSLFPDFADALNLADKLIITDIYAAREKYDGTIHSCDLALEIPKAIYMNDMDAIKKYIKKNAKENDLIITMGAGDVYKIGYSLINGK